MSLGGALLHPSLGSRQLAEHSVPNAMEGCAERSVRERLERRLCQGLCKTPQYAAVAAVRVSRIGQRPSTITKSQLPIDLPVASHSG